MQRCSLHTSHQRTDSQPLSEQELPRKDCAPSSRCGEHGTDQPFTQPRAGVQQCPLPAPPPCPAAPRGGDRKGKRESVGTGKHCSARANSLVCYQHRFGHKSEMQQRTAAVSKATFIPGRPSPVNRGKSPRLGKLQF